MKMYIIIVLLGYYLFPSFVIGQPQIITLKVLPENVLNSDSVKIVAETLFDPGAGWFDSSTYQLNGNEIIITGHYSRNGASLPNESIDTIKIGKLESGNYTLIYKAVVAINLITDLDTIQFTVGVNNVTQQDFPKLKIYPNPTQNLIHIDVTENGFYELKIYDLLGREKYAEEYESSINVNTLNFTRGLYFIEILNKANSQKSVHRVLLN